METVKIDVCDNVCEEKTHKFKVWKEKKVIKQTKTVRYLPEKKKDHIEYSEPTVIDVIKEEVVVRVPDIELEVEYCKTEPICYELNKGFAGKYIWDDRRVLGRNMPANLEDFDDQEDIVIKKPIENELMLELDDVMDDLNKLDRKVFLDSLKESDDSDDDLGETSDGGITDDDEMSFEHKMPTTKYVLYKKVVEIEEKKRKTGLFWNGLKANVQTLMDTSLIGMIQRQETLNCNPKFAELEHKVSEEDEDSVLQARYDRLKANRKGKPISGDSMVPQSGKDKDDIPSDDNEDERNINWLFD